MTVYLYLIYAISYEKMFDIFYNTRTTNKICLLTCLGKCFPGILLNSSKYLHNWVDLSQGIGSTVNEVLTRHKIVLRTKAVYVSKQNTKSGHNVRKSLKHKRTTHRNKSPKLILKIRPQGRINRGKIDSTIKSKMAHSA